MARGFQPGPAAQVGRYGLRTNAQVERRTTPYYYHELLLQKNLFDSSLNLLPQQQGQQLDQAKSKNSNLQLEQQQQQHQHLADASNTGKRAPMAKPQQRFISNGQGRTNYSSSSGSLSNLLGNGNGLSNGHESSDGTLADEGSFSLAFNNLSNQIASLNNSSSLNNNNCSTISSSSNNNNNNNHNNSNINNNNNNSHVNNADSNNNVGQINECIA